MDKVLQMNFRTGVGRNMRISLEDPREDITAEDIKAVMNLIISKNIFNVEGGLADIASAYIVTTQTQQVAFE